MNKDELLVFFGVDSEWSIYKVLDASLSVDDVGAFFHADIYASFIDDVLYVAVNGHYPTDHTKFEVVE